MRSHPPTRARRAERCAGLAVDVRSISTRRRRFAISARCTVAWLERARKEPTIPSEPASEGWWDASGFAPPRLTTPLKVTIARCAIVSYA